MSTMLGGLPTTAREELGHLLDLVTEARALAALMPSDVLDNLATSRGTSDECSLRKDLEAAAAHVRSAIARLPKDEQ